MGRRNLAILFPVFTEFDVMTVRTFRTIKAPGKEIDLAHKKKQI